MLLHRQGGPAGAVLSQGSRGPMRPSGVWPFEGVGKCRI
jgi:hypothetical protein